MKIPNFKARMEEAMKDPLKTLALELHKEGYTERDVYENTKKGYPDTYSLKLRSYVRDLDIAAKGNICLQRSR